jgi:DNA-binding CsgD family transcriptional regulator
VRIAVAAGDRARAETVYRATQHLHDANPGVGSLAAAAAHARGLLYGDEAALGRAVDGFRRSPRPLARASAFEDAAASLRTAGQRARARALLAEAADERAAAGLPRPSGRTGRSTQAGGLGALTRAELSVARLVAQGLSNRKAAAELFLSPHTVDSHLRHIFAKLGLNGRVALAAFMAEHDRHSDIP